MVDEPDSLTLRYLRRIDEKLDRLLDDVRDLKVRMTASEESAAGMSRRLDRIESRLDRMDRRLDLVGSEP